MGNLVLLVLKNHLPIQFVENILLKWLIMKLCPYVVFPSKKTFCKEMLLDLVEETKQLFVLPILTNCVSTTSSFYIWISKGAHDVFALVVIFGGEVGCQNILKLCYLKHLKLQAKLWWEFARSFKTLWFDKKDPCLCQGWRI